LAFLASRAHCWLMVNLFLLISLHKCSIIQEHISQYALH